MKRKHLLIATLLSIPAAFGVWLGTGYYLGHEVAGAVQKTRTMPSRAWGLQVMDLHHQRGLLQSEGLMNVRLDDACGAPPGAESVSMQLRYQVDHFPTHRAPLRFSWTLEPAGETLEAMRQLVASRLSLHGDGEVAYGGGVSSSLALDEVLMRQEEHVLQMAASSGLVSWQDGQLDFEWTTPRIVVRGQGEAAEVTEATVRARLDDAARGTGTLALGFGKFSAPSVSAEGFSLETTATEDGDRMNASFSPRLRKLTTPELSLQDLALELGVKGLDTASLLKLGALAAENCGALGLAPGEQAEARQAAMTLVTRGFSAGITRVSGRMPEGAVDGRWTVEMAPSPGGMLRLQDHLSSSGHLSFTGQALTETQRLMALESGLAVAHEGGLRAAYEFGRGALTVNGQPVDSAAIVQALEFASLLLGRGAAR
jgi:hypothetical protein